MEQSSVAFEIPQGNPTFPDFCARISEFLSNRRAHETVDLAALSACRASGRNGKRRYRKNAPTAAEFGPTEQFRIATKNPITGKMLSTTRMPSTMAPLYSAGMWPKSSVT